MKILQKEKEILQQNIKNWFLGIPLLRDGGILCPPIFFFFLITNIYTNFSNFVL